VRAGRRSVARLCDEARSISWLRSRAPRDMYDANKSVKQRRHQGSVPADARCNHIPKPAAVRRQLKLVLPVCQRPMSDRTTGHGGGGGGDGMERERAVRRCTSARQAPPGLLSCLGRTPSKLSVEHLPERARQKIAIVPNRVMTRSWGIGALKR